MCPEIKIYLTLSRSALIAPFSGSKLKSYLHLE